MMRIPPSSRRRCSLGLLAVALLLAGVVPVRAATGFTAAVDRARVSQAEPIHLTLSISSDQNLGHVSAPELDLSAFDVYGPSMSTRMEMVSGRTTFARDLVYTLYGRTPGKAAIGPARVEVGGKVLEAKAIEVEIVRGAPRRAAPGAAGGGAGEPARGTSLEENLFVRVVADRDTAYVGEQVVVRFDLCYRYNLRDVGFAEIPTFTGFWAKELFVAQRLAPERETLGGLPFNVAPLRRVALFPTGAGTLVVEPMAVSCSVPQGRSRGSAFDALSLFDDPIFGRGQAVMVRSEPLAIVVLPVPEVGRPASYTGAVGRFGLRAEAQPLDVKAGDPVTLHVEVEGTGNLQALPDPDVEPAGFKVYDPTVEVEEGQIENGRYGGRKKLEYILIPERGGALRIPALSVSYFDPDERRYRTVTTQPIDVRSRGAEGDAAAEPSYDLTRREIEQLGRDIRHIKPDVDGLGGGLQLYRSAPYWLAHLLLPVTYLALVAYRKHRRRLEGDIAYARRRQAAGAADRRLQSARGLAERGDEFHAALQEALVAFVGDQLNEPVPAITRDRCRQLLVARGLSATLVGRVDGFLERCEFGRFAPGHSDRAARRDLLALGEELIDTLREALS